METIKLPKTTSSDKTNFVFSNKHKAAEVQISDSVLDLYDIDWLMKTKKPQVQWSRKPNRQVDPSDHCTIMRLGLPSHNEGQLTTGHGKLDDLHAKTEQNGGRDHWYDNLKFEECIFEY